MKKKFLIALLLVFISFPIFAVMYEYETEYGKGMAGATLIDELYGKKNLLSQEYLFDEFGYDNYIGINKLSKIQDALLWKALNNYYLEPGEVWLVYSRPDNHQSAFILAYIEKDLSVTYWAIGPDIFMY